MFWFQLARDARNNCMTRETYGILSASSIMPRRVLKRAATMCADCSVARNGACKISEYHYIIIVILGGYS